MATTYTYKNGTGNHTTTFPFTFPYIKDTDVKVEVLESGAWVTKTKDTHYEFTNATTLKFKDGHAPADVDNNIKISRATDADKLTATFYPGSAIRSVDLNDNFTQNLYSTEESKETGDDAQLATDRLVAVTYDGGTTWTQTGNNTNASTDPKGVGYSITQAEAAVTTSNTANTTAASAVTTANSAVTTANSATTTANSAVTTANAATTTANSAVTTANTASTNATNAVNTANAAFQRDGSATMTGNIVFEGATDDGNETTLTVTDPTADRIITLPNVTGTVVTTGDTGTVTSTMITDGTIATADVANSAITDVKIANNTINAQNKIADGTIVSANIADANIITDKIGASQVTTVKIADSAITNAKLGNDAVTSAKIIDDGIDSEHYSAASIDTEHIADANITTVKIADANITAGKLADNAVTIAKLGCEETTLTANSDAHVPTSKAVSDYVVNLLNDVGGFYPILDDQKFPNTNPDPNDDAGTIVSIADAGGLVVNGSGVSTTGRTLGGSTVTINGIDSSLHNTTIAAGKGMLVQTTSTLNTYDYHRLVLDEAGVASADTLISDFNERYRTSASRTADNHSSNHDGDLYFDQGTNTMYVYDGAYDAGGAWKQVTSAGEHKYLYLCPAGGSGAPTINNNIATYDLREDSNSGTVATVSVAAQLTISVNGVLQKPNTGTSAPSEGFALVDGNTIIFGANLPTGSEVFIIQSGTATTINTPADNSVTTAKIASAAVTTAKIADDAVDGAKLANNIDIAGTLDVTDNAVFDAKVGIGTTTPQEALHIHSTTVGGAAIELSENAGSAFQGLIQMRGNDMEIRGSSGQMEFYTGNADGASSTQRLAISNTGAATFTGYTTVGPYASATAGSNGVQLRDNGEVLMNKNSGDAVTIYNNSATKTFTVGADGDINIAASDGTSKVAILNSGAATFAGEVGIGSNFTNAATNASGIWLSDTGRTTFYHSSSESGNYLTCTQADGSGGSSEKASISGAGDATFAGNLTMSGATSWIGAYQMFTGNPAVGTATAIGTDMLAGSSGQFTSKTSSASASNSIAWRGYHGTTRTSLIQADGAAEFAAGAFAVDSDGEISTNIHGHGHLKLDSGADFSSPNISLAADTGAATFSYAGAFNTGSDNGHGVKLSTAANAGTVLVQCTSAASQYTEQFAGYWGDDKNSYILANGTISCSSLTETSDIALKTDIKPITNGLDKIKQITGYKYKFKNDGRDSMGVTAQDVEKVFPELVHGEDGSKSLQYSGLIGALIESVKELSNKVAALEAA